jgi:hypothetical protein
MQHLRVKIFTRQAAAIHEAIPVFHRWIQKSVLPELLVDVADYQHVPNGPGIMLIGHDSHYALDRTKGRLGLLYTRRTTLEGSTAHRVRSAIDAAQTVCRLLENEPEFAGKLTFDYSALEISVNDRALAPNSGESYEALSSELKPVLDDLWGPASYRLSHIGEPRELLTIAASRA